MTCLHKSKNFFETAKSSEFVRFWGFFATKSGKMEEGPQTTEAPEAPTEAPTPMDVETEGAVAGDEVKNPPNQEGQEVRNSSLPKNLVK